MFVIKVITFSKSAPVGTLSYRTRTKLPLGSLVEVPLRRKKVLGVVVETESVQSARATLRSASYTLRSGSAISMGRMPPQLMQAAQEIAYYHATTLGAVLSVVLTKSLVETGFPKLQDGPGFVETYAEAPRSERLELYRAYARQAHEAGTVVLVLAPTHTETEQLTEALGLDGVVVTTPAQLFTPIKNLGGIIVERESAGAYVLQRRPYLDFRQAARALAHTRAVPLMFGDYPLRIETRPVPAAPLEHKQGEGFSAALGTCTVLDVRTKATDQKTTYAAVPPQIVKELRKTVAANGRALVLAVRKGYAPAVVCRDCGATVKDERGRTLALIGTASGTPILRSPDGQTERGAKVLCDVCGSWNLVPLGVGVERVALELAKAFPSSTIVRFDSELVRTPAQAKKALERAQTPGNILVATEAVLPWLTNSPKREYAAIASADSLLAMPFWRARERLAHIGLVLREQAQHVSIATRRPDDAVFSAILDPATTNFFEEEAQLREALRYPPYATLLTFSHQGTKEQVLRTSTHIAELLASYEVTTLTPRLETKGRYRGTSVLKCAKGAWPNEVLSKLLQQLPLSVRVCVDPESLW